MMNRLHLLCLTLVAGLFVTGATHAADATALIHGDKVAGRKLIYTCNGCHGVPGYSNAEPQYPVPKIAGQNEQYIINALHGYQSGDRAHPTMTAQAQSLSDQDIADIAAYLSSLAPASPPTSPEQTKVLSQLATSDAGKKAAVCTSCHGQDGNSIDPQYPRLAGQYNEYLQQILHEYKDGRRHNAIMKGMVTTLSDKDIEDIAAYFATLPAQIGKPAELSTLQGHIQGD